MEPVLAGPACYGPVVPNMPRRPLNILVNQAGYQLIAGRAKSEAAGNVSEMVRRMLKYASTNMPKGWK